MNMHIYIYIHKYIYIHISLGFWCPKPWSTVIQGEERGDCQARPVQKFKERLRVQGLGFSDSRRFSNSGLHVQGLKMKV